MTRYQLPDTPEDIRRAKRAPIVTALFVGSLVIGALLLHPSFRTALGEDLSRALQYAEPVAELIVPDGIPLLLPSLPALSPDVLDVRARASSPECDRRYYEPGVR
jgi:hypothetical protein